MLKFNYIHIPQQKFKQWKFNDLARDSNLCPLDSIAICIVSERLIPIVTGVNIIIWLGKTFKLNIVYDLSLLQKSELFISWLYLHYFAI